MELLQNADDNVYTRSKEPPFVHFAIYNSQIVIDCNEDGFTPANLTALCDVGKSSKKGAQGYIGEKGIGFKSVFMVATRVSVRSNGFSFYFQHRQGDSGMGMITPVWEDVTGSLPRNVTTRITLHLNDTESNGLSDPILRQFDQFEETMLLFLKNIRQVIISQHDQDGSLRRKTKHSIAQVSPTRHRLSRKVRIASGATRTTVREYHVTKHTAENLAPNENRKYSDEELQGRLYSRSEVMLAFPLTEQSEPIIEKQQLYAFLPVRREGFDVSISQPFWGYKYSTSNDLLILFLVLNPG